MSQTKGVNCTTPFQGKAINKSNVSSSDLVEKFAFFYTVLGIILWTPGSYLSHCRTFAWSCFFYSITYALVLGATLSSYSAETSGTLYLSVIVSGGRTIPGHSARHSLFLYNLLKCATQNKLRRIHCCHVAIHNIRKYGHGSLRVTLQWHDSLALLNKRRFHALLLANHLGC